MAVLTPEELGERSLRLQKGGKSVVFTNGCFDLIHRGHIEMLRRGKQEGDVLFVGVNGDDSVRRLKGRTHPIQSVEDRAVILDSFIFVDDVAIFHEDTPERLIKLVRPNVLVKGADYEENEIVGAEIARAWGGRVVRVPLVEGRGTEKILDRIRAGQ